MRLVEIGTFRACGAPVELLVKSGREHGEEEEQEEE